MNLMSALYSLLIHPGQAWAIKPDRDFSNEASVIVSFKGTKYRVSLTPIYPAQTKQL